MSMKVQAQHDGDPLPALRIQFVTLQSQLDAMREDYEKLSAYHNQKCLESLRVSLNGLFEVILYVRKWTKKLSGGIIRATT